MNELSSESLAAMAMRLRAATQIPPLRCKEVLAPLSEEIRRRYVERFEANPSSLLVDPIEVQPEYQDQIAEIRREAERLLELGTLGEGRRGRSGRMWGWMKAELEARHQIKWRTPIEMSPHIALD